MKTGKGQHKQALVQREHIKGLEKSKKLHCLLLACSSVTKTYPQTGSFKTKHQNNGKTPTRQQYAFDIYSINVYLCMESLALECMSRYFFLAVSARVQDTTALSSSSSEAQIEFLFLEHFL